MGDASWFPTPPRKQSKDPLESTRLFTGGMLAVVAFVAIVLALTDHSHSHKPTSPAATTTTQQGSEAGQADRRAAFEACLKSAGVSGGGSRFSRGSADKTQAAFAVCNSLIGGSRAPGIPPATPARGATEGPPAA
ncbi:MAG TPA: hypothetical protein VGL76_02895 [Gaiellaceae bacterium]|jgi:hypothetical protein